MHRIGNLSEIRRVIKKRASLKRAKTNAWFFKTNKGEYGEGDQFVGLNVPDSRKIAQQFRAIPLSTVLELLASQIHEERLIALFMLVHRYERGESADQKKIFSLYLRNTKYINNWDLVDSSAAQIVGRYLDHTQNRSAVLAKLVQSKSLWERRIAIIATYHFIQQNDFKDTLRISKALLHDTHDLIHKAVGWMLREVGKRDKETLVKFLRVNYTHTPRTMLRYAIEKFPEKERLRYLRGYEV